jgi:sugar phosphate isomerase/epimerase
MIYISSSCIKTNTIKESVEILARAGFRRIELSGGTRYYPEYLQDLLDLKEKYNLEFLLHNYFPPPQTHFVVNLASLNDQLYERSLAHCLEAIRLSKIFGSKKYAVHAGFMIDIGLHEIGKTLDTKKLNDRGLSLIRLEAAYDRLLLEAGGQVEIYFENNVLSQENFTKYSGVNPLFLTHASDHEVIMSQFNFKLLLDVAHLYVSSCSLGLDFQKQLEALIGVTDYVHVSDNDGTADMNDYLDRNSPIMRTIAEHDLRGKTITLETYCSMDKIQESYETLKSILIQK